MAAGGIRPPWWAGGGASRSTTNTNEHHHATRSLPHERHGALFIERQDLRAMKVLLVDDEREICWLIATALARDGIGSASAHSLAEARNALEQASYDVVFVDIHLPDGLGYDLIPMIRRSSPSSKVIAISAVDGEGATATKRGVDLFIAKPFTRNLILEKLHGLLPQA